MFSIIIIIFLTLFLSFFPKGRRALVFDRIVILNSKIIILTEMGKSLVHIFCN